MSHVSKRLVSKWNARTEHIVSRLPEQGIFLTGIENSDPVVGASRRDQLKEAHDFYVNYEQRLRNIQQLGISWIRFGPAYSQTHIGEHQYDFAFSDRVVALAKELNLTIIADLLHFGLPDWMHERHPNEPYFQNPDFPHMFAGYVKTFAERYPHITYYTPVNEPFVTAMFSTKVGIWNEQLATEWHDDRAFVKASANIAKASILARNTLEMVWKEQKRDGHPLYVQNESFEKAYAAPSSGRGAEVRAFNRRRFLPLDLMFGKRDKTMKLYVLNQGMAQSDYEWFMREGNRECVILGIDHYPSCIHTYESGAIVNHGPGHDYELESLVKEYWNRYRMPLLHLEVNAWPEHATQVCADTYEALKKLRSNRYPVLGMSWFGDEYQVGWQTAMVGEEGTKETPVGLFYKGELQPVGMMFQKFSSQGLPSCAF